MSRKPQKAIRICAAFLLSLSVALILLGGEAIAQSSSSITVNGRSVTIVGGSNQQLRSGLLGGATITVDGTVIEVGDRTVSLLDEDYEIDPEGPMIIRVQGDEIIIEVDGETVATVTDTSRGEREFARLVEAAEGGDAVAQRRLGIRYRNGEGVEQDPERALDLLGKASEQGDAEAQTNLAIMLAHGEGGTTDLEAARGLYEKAAAQGQAAAQSNLGVMLIEGEGGPVDEERGLDLMRKAAEGGNRIAAHNLYLLLRPGGRFATSGQEAVGYLKRAAELGLSRAMDQLGELYKRGNLVEADTEVSEEHYRQAVERDYQPALFGLADLLLNHGETTPERLEEGLRLLQIAVDNDDIRAINDWAVYNFEGIFVDKNEVEGVSLFRRAVDAGNILAKRNLGVAYEYGRGVEQDLTEAQKWYQAALDGGHPDVPRDLERLAGKIPSYWYARDDEALGPVGLGELQALIDNGEVGSENLIWKPGLPEWVPASADDELRFP